jgi:hypothetical protein
MRSSSSTGTAPEAISRSVPRERAVNSVRTSASPDTSGASGTSQSAPTMGAT